MPVRDCMNLLCEVFKSVCLLFSGRLMLAALVVLILIVISNFSALFFCCFATDNYALWLQTYYPKDLACLRILVGRPQCEDRDTLVLNMTLMYYHPLLPEWWCVQVQNGLALYTTWTSVASLINFSLVLHLWGVETSTAATASLCILFAELVGWWALIEQVESINVHVWQKSSTFPQNI